MAVESDLKDSGRLFTENYRRKQAQERRENIESTLSIAVGQLAISLVGGGSVTLVDRIEKNPADHDDYPFHLLTDEERVRIPEARIIVDAMHQAAVKEENHRRLNQLR